MFGPIKLWIKRVILQAVVDEFAAELAIAVEKPIRPLELEFSVDGQEEPAADDGPRSRRKLVRR